MFYPRWPSSVASCCSSAIAPDASGRLIGSVQSGIIDGLGWYYVLIVAVFVVFAIWMGLSRFGDIKLGKDDEKPEFGAALLVRDALRRRHGHRPGLLGRRRAAEPLRLAAGRASTGDRDRARPDRDDADVPALGRARLGDLRRRRPRHRLRGAPQGRPVSIRWALEPLLGDRVQGRLGRRHRRHRLVGTVFGVATSLGFGVMQISAGLDFVAASTTRTHRADASSIVGHHRRSRRSRVVSGVGKGIKWLSNFNMVLAGALLLFVLVAGPTLFLLRDFVQNARRLPQNLLGLTFDVSAFQGEEGQAWQAAWTTFYWGWWISWAPFVGIFIARISRGRTVREFVAGVLLVPTVVTFLWFSRARRHGALPRALRCRRPGRRRRHGGHRGGALRACSTACPAGAIVAGLAILLIVMFFVTSSDSGSLVVDMLASGGDPDPPTWSRVFWAVLERATAAVLLVVGVASGGTRCPPCRRRPSSPRCRSAS